MDALVLSAVLLAALLHASWNAWVKSGADRLASAAQIMAVAAMISLIGIPFLPLPPPHTWPWLIASALSHFVYLSLLVRSYAHADFSVAYPIARGTGPLLVALASATVFGETLPWLPWLGILITSIGIISMASPQRQQQGWRAPKDIQWALATGVLIATYTLIDARGVRSVDNPLVFILWMNLASAVPVLAFGFYRRGRSFGHDLVRNGRFGLAAGFIATLSYALVLWAMGFAHPGLVAATRETSVVFAALFARFVLGETLSSHRWPAILAVAIGLMLMNA